MTNARNTQFWFSVGVITFFIVVVLSLVSGLSEPRVEVPEAPEETLVEQCRRACTPGRVKVCTIHHCGFDSEPKIECWGPDDD